MKNCLNRKHDNRLARKLRSVLGETLSEVLVSVLIISLATVLFATMIGSASKLNAQAKAADSGVKSTQGSAEAGPWNAGSGNNLPEKIQVDGHDVNVWFNGGDGLKSYRINKTEVNP